MREGMRSQRLLAAPMIVLALAVLAMAEARTPAAYAQISSLSASSLPESLGDIAGAAAEAAESSRSGVAGDVNFVGEYSCLPVVEIGAEQETVCDSRISQTLPPFRFVLRGHADKESAEKLVEQILIYKDRTAAPFQTLDDVGSRVSDDIAQNGFEIRDMNFDGYLDLRIITSSPAAQNVSYRNWLWSESDERFHTNPALDGIISPDFDPDTQEVISRWRASAAEGGVDVYVWEGDQLRLIHRELDRYSDNGSCNRLFYDLIDGEMRKTGEGDCS